jgi:Calx-beta domain
VFVTLSHVNNAEVTVDFQTADDSATADRDYEEKSGTLFPLDGGTRRGFRNGPILAFVI